MLRTSATLGRLAGAGAFYLAASAVTVPAAAQPTLAVLGLASEPEDEQLARALSEALRAKAAGSTKFTVSSTGASLQQVLMVHDCDASDPQCLLKVAHGLDVERLAHGKLTRSGEPPTLRAEVELFSVTSTSVERTASAAVTDESSLDDVAADLVHQLEGGEPAPAAAAAAPLPDAADAAATTPEELPSEPTDDSPTSLRWLGYLFVGVAVASVGVAVFSWTQIDAATNNESFDFYRRRVGDEDPTATDVCARADAGLRYMVNEQIFNEVLDQCSRGKTFEVLQYVFLGTAVATGGVGAYFLLRDEGSDEAAQSGPRLALRPSVGPDGAWLAASMRF